MRPAPQPPRPASQARRLLLGLTLGALSCDFGPIDYEGKLCDNVRRCPSGWECSAAAPGVTGTCRQKAEVTVGRLKNGTFESGKAGWVASNATLVALDGGGHNSNGALQWSPDGLGDSVLTLDTPPVDSPESGWWCAQAWLKGSDGKSVDLAVFDRSTSLGDDTVTPSGGIWVKALHSTLPTGAATLSLKLVSRASSGARLLVVDDVELWPSPGLNCVSPP